MTVSTLVRPADHEYAPFYAGYIARVPDGDVVAQLEHQMVAPAAFLGGLTEVQGDHRYALG